jgi:ribose/xylose/arabinose/galactoside ABC-type transport system permease subunit
VLAQAAIGAAIGIAYSRRHLPSIIITLMLVAALFGLALVTRTGTHAAWLGTGGLFHDPVPSQLLAGH